MEESFKESFSSKNVAKLKNRIRKFFSKEVSISPLNYLISALISPITTIEEERKVIDTGKKVFTLSSIINIILIGLLIFVSLLINLNNHNFYPPVYYACLIIDKFIQLTMFPLVLAVIYKIILYFYDNKAKFSEIYLTTFTSMLMINVLLLIVFFFNLNFIFLKVFSGAIIFVGFLLCLLINVMALSSIIKEKNKDVELIYHTIAFGVFVSFVYQIISLFI